MFSAIFGYLLILLLTFTLVFLIAFLLRIALTIGLSVLYIKLTSNPAQGKVNSPLFIVHPVGFISSIFHGYASVWLGSVILKGLGLPVDWFLASFLVIFFLMFGLRRMKKPLDVDTNVNEKEIDDNVTLIINPEENQNTNPQDAIKNLMEKQMKGKVQEFMQGNTIIGLIGKLTGVAIATFHFISLNF